MVTALGNEYDDPSSNLDETAIHIELIPLGMV